MPAKLKKIREYFINPKIKNEDFGQCANQVIVSFDDKNISCSASEVILSKLIQNSMLTLPSCVFENPFQNNWS